MKRKSIFYSVIVFLCLFLSCCCTLDYDDVKAVKDDYRIYLYGERHGQEIIIRKELELWKDYYTNQKFRHLFLEDGYCDAVLLNFWMKAEDDEILDVIFKNLGQTNALSQTDVNYLFYKEIKETCPETIFHGTDVEHQFDTTGVYCLDYLKNHGMENTTEYELALESFNQGKTYYSDDVSDDLCDVYRENTMVENFKREFDALPSTEKVMGIYGSAHTKLNSKNYNRKVDNMATQLDSYYTQKEGKIIYSKSISKLK